MVHPSGILGPNDHALGETTRTVLQIIKGEMPMGMQGSFNLCDVRDLAAGTIAAIDKGRVGECYILANEPVTLKEMCEMIQREYTAKKISVYLPLGLADKIAQMLEKQAEKSGKKPLMTTFSVYNLARNNVFDYSKAKRELGYTTRSYQETIHDEVRWMIEEGLIEGNPNPTKLTNEQIRESGAMPEMIKAMEHDITDIPDVDPVATYKAIEEGVVGAYKAVETGAVNAYRKVEDVMVDKLFRKEGETVEEARKRLSQK